MRRRLYVWTLCGWVLTFGLVMASVWGMPGKQIGRPPAGKAAPGALLSPQESRLLTERFAKEIWPLLSRKESDCLACHGTGSMTPLKLFPDAESTFKTLLGDGHFDAENPGSILARVGAPDKARHMPPAPNKPWTDDEIQTLRNFTNDLYESLHKSGVKPDEMFPQALLAKYTGTRPGAAPDNTFLTYYQLKGKIRAIFGDDWQRGGHDLFNENIALFNGADFARRFDESSRASASFLTGVDMMARDVASRAYFQRSGPFAGHPETMPSPLGLKAPDPLYRREIDRLYDRLLFRSPTPQEMRDAFTFIQGVYREQKALAGQDQDARFELTVKDDQGRSTTENFSIRIAAGKLGCYEEYLNENEGPEGNLVKKKIGDRFTLHTGDTEQRLELSNRDTNGLVTLQSVELHGPLPADTIRTIAITDAAVQAQGAWNLEDRGGTKVYEDGNDNKGRSALIVPLKVEQSGLYEVSLWWRKNNPAVPAGKGRRRRGAYANADAVPVEIYSHDRSRLASPPPVPVPPKGEATFAIDESDDTRSYEDLGTTFRFGLSGGVEVANTGTHRTVVADCVRFVPVSGGDNLVVTNDKADGRDTWADYDPGTFSYYRKVSAKLLSDGNEKKGEKSLLFKPSVKKDDWKADRLYRVQVCYPGREGNETHAPIIVHAEESTPIVQVSYPYRATVGAPVTIDASASYNLQKSPLTYTWQQIGGPRIVIANAHAHALRFPAPAMTAQQAAWEGLCRALMKHPDFLFTRPCSLATVTNPRERRRLQLAKIAQDLVGRTPSPAEVAKVDAPLSSLIDGYLNSPEFRDFYFRRVRLYLESRGTDVDDEPVRLWCYIAFHDRPFKEILTADYTVDPQMRRQSRPAYCGKSGVLTMTGFIKGKPGLPHFNYAAQVCEKFLGYVFEVPPEVVAMRNTITAVSTTNPNTVCYSCHKVLTPLAYQRSCWTDDGEYRPKDDDGKPIDATDRKLVPSYPFKGEGLQAFALQAQNKERFVRTILQTHFIFYFGREMRYQTDERGLYKRLWDTAQAHNFAIRPILKTLLTSPEYLDGPTASAPAPKTRSTRYRTARR